MPLAFLCRNAQLQFQKMLLRGHDHFPSPSRISSLFLMPSHQHFLLPLSPSSRSSFLASPTEDTSHLHRLLATAEASLALPANSDRCRDVFLHTQQHQKIVSLFCPHLLLTAEDSCEVSPVLAAAGDSLGFPPHPNNNKQWSGFLPVF